MKGAFGIGPGAKADAADKYTIVSAASQATGRQRGEGRWPSGNSRSRNVTDVPAYGTQTHVRSQAIGLTHGSEPGSTSAP